MEKRANVPINGATTTSKVGAEEKVPEKREQEKFLQLHGDLTHASSTRSS